MWSYDVGNNKSTKDKFAFKHPAIFPEKLAQDHILSWSNEGDIVLDCFMGSGTTGKMALLNNRKFIGIEKVEKYFKISKQRIENVSKYEASIPHNSVNAPQGTQSFSSVSAALYATNMNNIQNIKIIIHHPPLTL